MQSGFPLLSSALAFIMLSCKVFSKKWIRQNTSVIQGLCINPLTSGRLVSAWRRSSQHGIKAHSFASMFCLEELIHTRIPTHYCFCTVLNRLSCSRWETPKAWSSSAVQVGQHTAEFCTKCSGICLQHRTHERAANWQRVAGFWRIFPGCKFSRQSCLLMTSSAFHNIDTPRATLNMGTTVFSSLMDNVTLQIYLFLSVYVNF